MLLWFHDNPEYFRLAENYLAKASQQTFGPFVRLKLEARWVRWRELLATQHNQCAICSGDISVKFADDHSHETGQVRGLLCVRCNTRLPAVEDQEFVESARRYLMERAA